MNKMKTIEVDEELYRYIANHTQHIGESASVILRRMLKFNAGQPTPGVPVGNGVAQAPAAISQRDGVRVIRELLLSDQYAEQNKAVNRFILVLATLYNLEATEFAAATESLHGRTRLYFSGDQQKLLQNGSHTKPKHVAGTPYWVITNTNTERKRSMLQHIMLAMKFSPDLTEKVCGTI